MPGRCPAGQFQCVLDKACVPQSSICNGVPECRDASDENNCGKISLIICIYPPLDLSSNEEGYKKRKKKKKRKKQKIVVSSRKPIDKKSRSIKSKITPRRSVRRTSGDAITASAYRCLGAATKGSTVLRTCPTNSTAVTILVSWKQQQICHLLPRISFSRFLSNSAVAKDRRN